MADTNRTPKKKATRARKASTRKTTRKRRPAGRAAKARWNAPPWVAPFLQNLGDLQDVKAAIAAVNKGTDEEPSTTHVARSTVYEHRERHETFAARWDQLLEHRVEDLGHSAWKRATDGHLRPVFHKGQRVGFERVYETGLTIFLLRTACGFTTPREAAGGARGTAQQHAQKVVDALESIEDLEGREEPPPHEVEAPSAKAPA